MGRFHDLNDNLNDILTKVILNENLCKLLYYTDSTPLSKPNVPTPENLLYTKIFPHTFTIGVNTEATVMLIVTLNDFQASNGKAFKDGLLSFYIICHHSLWRVENGHRPFYMMEEIDKLFNNENVVGIGKAQFKRGRMIPVNDNYSGYLLDYLITDFN